METGNSTKTAKNQSPPKLSKRTKIVKRPKSSKSDLGSDSIRLVWFGQVKSILYLPLENRCKKVTAWISTNCTILNVKNQPANSSTFFKD